MTEMLDYLSSANKSDAHTEFVVRGGLAVCVCVRASKASQAGGRIYKSLQRASGRSMLTAYGYRQYQLIAQIHWTERLAHFIVEHRVVKSELHRE